MVYAGADELFKHEESIKTNIDTLIKSFDTKAFVTMSIQWQSEKVNLPSSPFIFENTFLQQDGLPKAASVNMTIYSSIPLNETELTEVLASIIKPFGVKPKVVWKKWQGVEAEKKVEEKADGWREWISKNSTLATLATIFVSLFMLISIIYLKGQQMVNTLQKGLLLLSEAVQTVSLSASPGGSITANNTSSAATSGSIEINQQAQGLLSSMSQEQIVAILSDAYWSMEDEYAAHVWKQLNLGHKNQIMEHYPMFVPYVDHFIKLAPVDKKFAESPYYFSAIPTNHISNQDLGKFIGLHPELFSKIAPMRKSKVNLSSQDKVKLLNAGAISDEKFSLLKNELTEFKASDLREFQSRITFSFTGLDEETEILNMPENDLNMMKSFPTIGWGIKLEQKVMQSILDEFTARELAMAWIAPEDVLKKFTTLLPTKKAQLLDTYIKTMSPNRESVVYQKLLARIFEKLDAQFPQKKAA
jgi:hypothetical protein